MSAAAVNTTWLLARSVLLLLKTLWSQGVSSAVEVEDFGEEQPVEKGHAEASWSKTVA